MKWILVLTIVLCSYSPAYGQGTVSGRVFDKDSMAVAAATVYLLHQADSGMVMKTLTDDAGHYAFRAVPEGSYLVRANVMGRQSTMKKLMIWDGSRVKADLRMEESVLLSEVKVVSTGISVNGDTTTYAVNRFTSGSERNLREVLDRLPNINVDKNGNSVTANGKHVSRVLLEGQDLFQGNVSIPLENISADGVRTVDIIDNYSEYDIFNGFRTTDETVLNVGMDEKSKNRLKGELEGHGGVMNKYEAKDASLYIGRKYMLSGIIASNNTGKRLLNFRDILNFSGGLNNLLSGENPVEELTRKVEAYAAFTDSRRDMTRRENSMAALNFMANPSPKVRLTIGVIYGYDHYRSRNESRYEYASGFNYDKMSTEKSGQHNGLLNIKLAYTPSKDLSMIYSGNMLVAAQERKSEHLLDRDSISFREKPATSYLKNNLLVARRFGQDVLSLSLDYSRSHRERPSTYASSYEAAESPLGMNLYGYTHKNDNDTYAAQLFYLHRLSNNYYLRLALKAEQDRQRFFTGMEAPAMTTDYDNDASLDYTTYYGEVMGGKDKGDLTLSLRLRYMHTHASTNIRRDFRRTAWNGLSPMLQVKYQFTPYHYLMANYEYALRRNAIASLIDGLWLESYDRVTGSEVDRFFSASHKVSLSHLLMLPYAGVNLMTMASYENAGDAIADAYTLEGYVNKTEKRPCSGSERLTLTSMAEYKFLFMPLNARCQLGYVHADNPIYYGETLYAATSDNLSLRLQLVTFHKRGFNGDLSWTLSTQSYEGVPMANRLTTNELSGLLSWQDGKLYAAIDARLNTYHLGQAKERNLYYGFDLRYDLTDNITLRLRGMDVAHLRERRQMTGNVTAYYSVNSITRYMPGYVMAGISVRY